MIKSKFEKQLYTSLEVKVPAFYHAPAPQMKRNKMLFYALASAMVVVLGIVFIPDVLALAFSKGPESSDSSMASSSSANASSSVSGFVADIDQAELNAALGYAYLPLDENSDYQITNLRKTVEASDLFYHFDVLKVTDTNKAVTAYISQLPLRVYSDETISVINGIEVKFSHNEITEKHLTIQYAHFNKNGYNFEFDSQLEYVEFVDIVSTLVK